MHQEGEVHNCDSRQHSHLAALARLDVKSNDCGDRHLPHPSRTVSAQSTEFLVHNGHFRTMGETLQQRDAGLFVLLCINDSEYPIDGCDDNKSKQKRTGARLYNDRHVLLHVFLPRALEIDTHAPAADALRW